MVQHYRQQKDVSSGARSARPGRLKRTSKAEAEGPAAIASTHSNRLYPRIPVNLEPSMMLYQSLVIARILEDTELMAAMIPPQAPAYCVPASGALLWHHTMLYCAIALAMYSYLSVNH